MYHSFMGLPPSRPMQETARLQPRENFRAPAGTQPC